MRGARFATAGAVMLVLAVGATPARAERYILTAGTTVRVTTTNGTTVEAYDRDILDVSEGAMGQPVPTLNSVTAMIVKGPTGAVICTATPLSRFESDLLGSQVRIVSTVSNCAADLTWIADPLILPEQVTVPEPVVLSLMRDATVAGSLLGSALSADGRVSQGFQLVEGP